MAKQTFTTGQVLTAAQVNSLQANDFNQTVSVKTANYTLAAADKGTRIEFNTSGSVTCTVNSGLFDAGDTLVIQNRGAGTATITAGTATVNTSASLALAQYSAGTLYFVSDSAALFFGDAAGISASIVDAKGDLIVGTADNTVGRLAVGTNGYTLVADSSTSTGLVWQAPATGGKVLQVVQGTLTANFSTASASYVDVGLSVSITPSSATSKIFVAVSAPNAYTVNGASSIHNYSIFNLVRTSTQLVDAVIGNYNYASSNDPEFYCGVNITYLDSPATTSATTYKVQAKKGSSTAAKIDASGTRIHSIVVMEIGA